MTSMSENILEARAMVKKVRCAPKTRLRRRQLRIAEENLATLREALERGAREVCTVTPYVCSTAGIKAVLTAPIG